MTQAPLVLDRVRIARPAAPAVPGSVLIEGGRLRRIGQYIPPGAKPGAKRHPAVQRIDCEGAVLFPGFVDDHCHPLALGAALTAADCRPTAVASIDQIKDAIRRWASEHPDEPWVRAFGYDELLLQERRHPDRLDLDAAESRRPVVLTHGSGHALVLNTAGLLAAGINESTDEPPGGYIDREPTTGRPGGLLLEMTNYVTGRAGQRPGAAAVRKYALAANNALLRAGVTAVTDAGPSNGLATLEQWAALRRVGVFRPAVTMMRSPEATIPRPAAAGLAKWVRPGHVKVMITCVRGAVIPAQAELDRLVAGSLAAGDGVAVHAVEAAAVLAACHAFEAARRVAGAAGATGGRHRPPPRRSRDSGHAGPREPMRIEHAAEAPLEVCRAIARAGASVTTQPGFIIGRGDRYLAAAAEGGFPVDDLYPVHALLEQGVRVRASSDAPYGPLAPLEAVGGAVSRVSGSGKPVGASQATTASRALSLYFTALEGRGEGPAWAELLPGTPADLVLLSEDPQQAPPGRIGDIEVRATIIAGEVVWRA